MQVIGKITALSPYSILQAAIDSSVYPEENARIMSILGKICMGTLSIRH
jgi:hypothetical protein